MTAFWTLGENVEYENGWLAEVMHVDGSFAILRKRTVEGAHFYEPVRRENPPPFSDDVEDVFGSSNPGEDEPTFHTLDAALIALKHHMEAQP